MFKRAQRKKAKLRLAMFGPSGSGKTYSSLLVAQGLGKKIALIDTEQGSGELYAHLCEYDVAPISAPFTPQKYIDAIKFAENAGYDVLIIDSLSHAWAGEGGLLDMHDKATDASRTKNSYVAWREVTPLHNKLIDTILQSQCHVIITARSKVAYEVQQNNRGKAAPVKVGMAPVFREGLDYEMTICLELAIDKHIATASKDRTSLFDGQYFVPSVDTGETLRRWLESGEDPHKTSLDVFLSQIAGLSTETAFIRFWNDNREELSRHPAYESDIKPAMTIKKAEVMAANDSPTQGPDESQRQEQASAMSNPEQSPVFVTAPQRKLIMAHFKNATRDERLQNIGSFLGRSVSSVSDLSMEEASRFIDAITNGTHGEEAA